VLVAGTALAAGVVLWNVGGRRALAARVGEAVERASTWHLTGWRLEGGRRIPWEVWGQRQPFLYEDRTGEKLVLDDGRARLETFPALGGSIAVRMPAQGSLESYEWARLTV